MIYKSRFLLIVMVLTLSFPGYAQSIEKIIFDTKDSTDGYYLAIQPRSKQIKGALVLLTSFTPPGNLVTETKLHNVASANEILTIVASTRQKLYADSAAIARTTAILQHIARKFSVDTSKFVLAGYDEAGNIALRYTELTYEKPSSFPIQPKAVIGIDSPVDLFALWHWSEGQIKKNFWPGAVGDAKYYLDVMTKENGTIYNNLAIYKKLSPFYKEEDTPGNEHYLRNIPVRLYYDTDIEWQLKNRRNSFLDTKMTDGSELIKRLLLSGNTQAEFVAAKQPGLRSDGVRHPNSISIVNEVECIQWIKKCLNIFDPNTWVAPYNLQIPKGWTTERFSLPPDFAPALSFKGIEDLRFTPGWGDVKSEEHWTYSFLWWLDDTPVIEADLLSSNLKAYYNGLVSRNITAGNISADKVVPTTVTVKLKKTAPGDLKTFVAVINMLDYHARKPIQLNGLIHVKDCNAQNHTALFFEISPQPFVHRVWKQMDGIRDGFRCQQ